MGNRWEVGLLDGLGHCFRWVFAFAVIRMEWHSLFSGLELRSRSIIEWRAVPSKCKCRYYIRIPVNALSVNSTVPELHLVGANPRGKASVPGFFCNFCDKWMIQDHLSSLLRNPYLGKSEGISVSTSIVNSAVQRHNQSPRR